jgi:biopolymer transport protein ExbB
MGNPSNFEGGDTANHPINTLGIIYKGGILVGLAIALFLMVVTFSIERFITLGKASGKGSINTFIAEIRNYLESDNIDAAIQRCDEQAGSVGNVIKSTLKKYKEMHELTINEAKGANIISKGEGGIVVADVKDKEQKVAAIQKALEESTALELPMLEKNLVIIATIVSIATLVGLIGTVLGMIRAFSALATAGAPDAVALSTGISEALINTAMGISTSTIATVAYNYFTSRIDTMTYSIDESGYSIIQTFIAKH